MFGSPLASNVQALAALHSCHSPTVTGKRPIAKAPTLTVRTGLSLASSLLPIANVEPGSATSSGQVGQSRMVGTVALGRSGACCAGGNAATWAGGAARAASG